MLARNAIIWTGKTVNLLNVVGPDPNRRGYWICRCKCGNSCSVGSMSLKGGQQSCGCIRKRSPHNKMNRTGKRYGKLVALNDEGNGRWLCQCDCGNTTSVLSTNLSHMAKGNMGCKNCGHRKDITGERCGLLVAESCEEGPLKRPPLWTFRCDCGNTIQGTVREYRLLGLRSCGCHDDAHCSWHFMMARCYNKDNNRYSSYGGRGIKVCPRWHKFENFIADMGERPKRHNLSRKRAEEGYHPDNCIWEHISKNCRDTKNDGKPTKPGLKKGAKARNVE